MLEHAFVLVAVGVNLDAGTVHHIVLPVAFVFGLGSGVEVGAVSIGFVVFPLSVIGVTVGMGELAFSAGFVLLPLAFVFGTVGPKLDAVSVAIRDEPFAFVADSVFELDELSFLDVHGYFLLAFFEFEKFVIFGVRGFLLVGSLAEFSDGFGVNFEGSGFDGFIIGLRGRLFVGTIFGFGLSPCIFIVERFFFLVVFGFLIIGVKDGGIEVIGVVYRGQLAFGHFVSEGLAELVVCAFAEGAALLAHGDE